MVHSISRWTRGVQVKLWDPLRTRAMPERLRDVFTTRRYTNPRLPLPLAVWCTGGVEAVTMPVQVWLFACVQVASCLVTDTVDWSTTIEVFSISTMRRAMYRKLPNTRQFYTSGMCYVTKFTCSTMDHCSLSPTQTVVMRSSDSSFVFVTARTAPADVDAHLCVSVWFAVRCDDCCLLFCCQLLLYVVTSASSSQQVPCLRYHFS